MKKFIYCLLAALLTQIILTVLAFQHLTWWQAVLASFVLFYVLIRLLVWAAKFLFMRFLRHAEDEALRAANPHLLEKAQVILHSITPSSLPSQFTYALDDPDLTDVDRDEQDAEYGKLGWHAIEVTIVPSTPTDPNLGLTWIPSHLSLLPYDADPPASSIVQLVKRGAATAKEGDGQQRYELHELSILQNDEYHLIKDDFNNYRVEGPQRLRFIVGIPRDQSLLKFLYHRVAFGRLEIHLPTRRLSS